ncbi:MULTISPECIES: DNA polymerase III subunit gamma/tau [Comamonas]|uniref:DNA polymerase III subunit gamma/tau n=1 Tax=Comamonas TaxID=283 RepID=UPI000622618F|nr:MULTISPECIES: DNA polymerase III subunit gamma/tau [Comamonas]KKI15189.1 DNA polymerase III subunit gamma/tau [Comamonas thiooxydans]TYK77930.1 DNA polymerase III subunit gamma/tau [Comamonas sp. Z1]
MSYLVLARKYRPRTFTEMVGQEHVVQALTNALTQQRLHHAYLFTGTRGVGKTTVSRILAKSLNCQGLDGNGGITATPCGVCAACTEIDSGRFPDYTELDAASNRGVDEVQSLLEQAVYKPVQGRFKVFMIDEVHMLTNTAFNAMLKTLEEPPEYLKFVLATTDPQKVPVTVLSRCLQFNLRPMAPETVLEHLTHVLDKESVPAEPQALRLLSRAARGSMRDALSLTDQAIAFGSGQLQETTVRQMLGSVDRSHVFRLIDALAQGHGRTVVEVSEELRHNGLSAASTLEEMCAVLQRMAVLQAVPDMPLDASDPEAAEVDRLASLMPRDETQLLYSICLHGRVELGLAPDEYAALTMALLRLLAFKPENAEAGMAEKKTPALRPSRPVVQAPAQIQPPPAVTEKPAAEVQALPSVLQPVVQAAPGPASKSTPAQEPVSVAGMAEPQQLQAVADREDSAAYSVARPVMQAVSESIQPPAPEVTPEPASVRQNMAAANQEAAAEVEQTPADDAPESAEAADMVDAPEEQDVSEAAWAGMPDEGWSDDGRWGDDADLDVGQPLHVMPPMESDEPAAQSASGGYVSTAQDAAPVERTAEGDLWFGVVQQLLQSEAVVAVARQLALQSQLLGRDGDLWLLRVESSSLNQAGTRDRLRAALEAAGHARQLQVEQGPVTDSPARRLALERQASQLLAEDIVKSNLQVQTLMRDFGAKIVPGSIKPISIQPE